MTDISRKLRLIYLPFLAISIGFITLYSLLHWALFIKTEIFSIKEDVLDFFLPFGLPWIPILLWLRPRIKLLDLQYKKGEWVTFYHIVAWVAIALPTLIAQNYLVSATGTLTPLATIGEVGAKPPGKYYTVSGYHVDQLRIGVRPTFEVSGRHNEHFDMRLYIVMPILNSAADSLSASCPAWLGVEYSNQVSNSLDSAEKEAAYRSFAEETQATFDALDANRFMYLEKVGNSDDGDGFRAAVQENRSLQAPNAPIFIARNEPFEQRAGNSLGWLLGTFLIGHGIFLIMTLFPHLKEERVSAAQTGQAAPDSVWQETRELLMPREGYYFTPIIIYLNVLVYMLMVVSGMGFISFNGEDLLAWGANYGPLTRQGEWWRLFTCTFLHGGIMHLAANMYGLFFVGVFLEPVLGKWRFLGAYVLTGLLASGASLWWYSATVSVGASGAIFGLEGVFLALLLTKIFPPAFSKVFLSSTLFFVGYNLLMGMAGNGIDNAAHIGGLVSGFVLGLLLYPMLKKHGVQMIEEAEE